MVLRYRLRTSVGEVFWARRYFYHFLSPETRGPDKGTRDRRAVARRSDTPRSPSKIHSQRHGGARTSNENFLNSPDVIRRVFQDVGAFRALLTVQSRIGFVT